MKSYNSAHPWPSAPLYIFSATYSKYALKYGIANTLWNWWPDPCYAGSPFILYQNFLHLTSGTAEDSNDGAVTEPSVNGVFWAYRFPQGPQQVTSVETEPLRGVRLRREAVVFICGSVD